MTDIYILFAEGFEEIEALMPADVLRRAGMKTLLVSASKSLEIKGAHGIIVKCDLFLEDIDSDNMLMLLLPGGMPGTQNLKNNPKVIEMVRQCASAEKWIAAICAAPMILGEMNLLAGRKATCYQGYEKYLLNADILSVPAITDGKIITGRGMGTAMEFSLEIVTQLLGEEKAMKMKNELRVENY
ncbi:MAG: DJ-1/PfpI family protein [Cytophagaceae bacterium]|jgi:4-methyl-5(b-hydroxyethyl)-thiazole monophosphate biosynthesis|nr:DJ-1/PfpI family protein [Cytophagaceae bacterium]